MKRLFFIAVLCGFAAAPAMADLFGFTFSNVQSTFDGVSAFSTMDWAQTTGDVYRNLPPAGTAEFDAGSWGMGSEDFSISMTISNLTATTADGTGSFAIKDIEGDTVAGNLSGTWAKFGNAGVFSGN